MTGRIPYARGPDAQVPPGKTGDTSNKTIVRGLNPDSTEGTSPLGYLARVPHRDRLGHDPAVCSTCEIAAFLTTRRLRAEVRALEGSMRRVVDLRGSR